MEAKIVQTDYSVQIIDEGYKCIARFDQYGYEMRTPLLQYTMLQHRGTCYWDWAEWIKHLKDCRLPIPDKLPYWCHMPG